MPRAMPPASAANPACHCRRPSICAPSRIGICTANSGNDSRPSRPAARWKRVSRMPPAIISGQAMTVNSESNSQVRSIASHQPAARIAGIAGIASSGGTGTGGPSRHSPAQRDADEIGEENARQAGQNRLRPGADVERTPALADPDHDRQQHGGRQPDHPSPQMAENEDMQCVGDQFVENGPGRNVEREDERRPPRRQQREVGERRWRRTARRWRS